ncbi:hypothetical protein AB0H58_09805 [Nocardia neocaledoniensis]|uniref:hypothetical protein n=1 Tax=Nocardia neocaledoniensis TaxID=236511 RepID=UPI0011935AB4|nr:hypothetical protein [Nocardia neocaledoniensis]GEM30007.1 hypothetical protein NN3_10140 [Nocardia neocaledoniensis NBRC 108232]
MSENAIVGALSFEIHQLMLMRCSDVEKMDKLAEFNVSLPEARRLSSQVQQNLRPSPEQFRNLKELIGGSNSADSSIRYASRLWPQFMFEAASTNSGMIGDARYVRRKGVPPAVLHPAALGTWSVTVDEFSALFGPLQSVDSWYPNEEYVFESAGRRYGVGFGWGLFLGVDQL